MFIHPSVRPRSCTAQKVKEKGRKVYERRVKEEIPAKRNTHPRREGGREGGRESLLTTIHRGELAQAASVLFQVTYFVFLPLLLFFFKAIPPFSTLRTHVCIHMEAEAGGEKWKLRLRPLQGISRVPYFPPCLWGGRGMEMEKRERGEGNK